MNELFQIILLPCPNLTELDWLANYQVDKIVFEHLLLVIVATIVQ